MINKLINTTTSRRIQRQLSKRKIYTYCYICQRRAGSYYADCSPAGFRTDCFHGNGKVMYSHKKREYQCWKHNRKKQWKN